MKNSFALLLVLVIIKIRNIRNPELVKMLEENYKEYLTEDKNVFN